MKELLALRHAKSSHSMPGLRDHDRSLNERGRNAAPRVGRLLARENLLPDLILCSSATRTMETTALVTAAMECEPRTLFLEELYLAAPDTILDAAMRHGEDCNRVLVVGHNPGMEDVMTLLGLGMREMPTAALAHITFETDEWLLATSARRITLENFWLARSLPD
ncbi:MAG: histidine phosphatase family protein [Phycisphaerales bacterium]|nr:histidine phosphatase family protein [Phycisphaerales bacterium]